MDVCIRTLTDEFNLYNLPFPRLEFSYSAYSYLRVMILFTSYGLYTTIALRSVINIVASQARRQNNVTGGEYLGGSQTNFTFVFGREDPRKGLQPGCLPSFVTQVSLGWARSLPGGAGRGGI